jgi:hypothetical protein
VTVTPPETTLIERYADSFVNRTSYRLRADVPEVDRAVKVIVTRLPAPVTFPGPTIKSYTLMIRPAVLSMVPALKNVVYPAKKSPSDTEVARTSEGLYDSFSSKAFTGCCGVHATVITKVLLAFTV